MLLSFGVFIPHHDLTPPFGCESVGFSQYSGLMVSEFYPCALCDDEYLVITNQCGFYIDLRNWSISDGEGTLTFITDFWLMQNHSVSISWNESSFWQAFGRLPDVFVNRGGTQAFVAESGNFRLGDAGDSIALISPGQTIVDFVCYGSCNETSPGWSGHPMPSLRHGEIAKRIRPGEFFWDSDTAADWSPFREFRYGYTELPGMSVQVAAGNITAFASPDNSLDVVLEALESTTRRISLCTYEFSSVPVTKALMTAKERGIDVHVLVDGVPAGGMSESEIACLSVLSRDGVDVRAVKGNTSMNAVQHIGALHAKYVVTDSSETVVMSENFVEQGVPTDKLFGNRGWGVKVSDGGLARYVEDMFEADSRLSRTDVVPWRSDPRMNQSAVLPKDPALNHTRGMFPSYRSTGPAVVTACISPDGSMLEPYLCAQVERSRMIVGEQFQADLFWEQRWSGGKCLSPLVTALESSMRRGSSVRLLFDSSWFNLIGNGAVVNSLIENSTLMGLDGQFKLMDADSPITALHNKGVIFDNKATLVSSNNWVSASFARNRELGLLVDSVEIADYFTKTFGLDWSPDDTPPIADAGPDLELMLGESKEISAGLSSDDRAIAGVWWDTDGDGQAESRNMTIEFAGSVPGSYHVVLTVTDAWGNSATDEVLIIVILPDSPGPGGQYAFGRGFVWIVPLVLAATYMFSRRLRRPRVPAGPRKLNHRPNA